MKVGFIGLGNMGSLMALNLHKAGVDVRVYNRSREKAEKLQLPVAETPQALATQADVLISMLADDEALEQVVFGENGIYEGMKPGTLHISMSTVSVAIVQKLTQAHQQAGHHFLSSPVFGRPDAAEKANLVILAAGPREQAERVQLLYQHMGRAWHFVGEEPWMANLFKMSGNFWITSMIETMGESLALIKKAGADHAQFFSIMLSVFQSPLYENYAKNILQENFTPAGFALKHGLKDVSLVADAGHTFSVPMPFVSLLHDSYMQAYNRGKGELDMSALARQIAENAGIS